jgi:hypothetical protein
MYQPKNPHYGRKFLLFEFLGAVIVFCLVAGIGMVNQPVYSVNISQEAKNMPFAGYKTTNSNYTIMNVQKDGLVMSNTQGNIKVCIWMGNVIPEAIDGYWYGINASVTLSINGKTQTLTATPYTNIDVGAQKYLYQSILQMHCPV